LKASRWRPDRSAADAKTHARFRLVVRGAVQGVGFRPFVYRRAQALGLVGWVGNAAEGVLIEAEGDRGTIADFIAELREAPPPNAAVSAIDAREIAPCGDVAFAIRPSTLLGARTAEPLPDLATCDDCLGELFDPADRRHLYPFINCTRCGPRYSIIEDLPYDRARTTMRHFPMCAACRAEYEDPSDRRFHAEPVACPVCGPQLALWSGRGDALARGHAAVIGAADALREGVIVAVKGIGGFHLMADATNEEAVRRLRLRKRRPDKPFAIMFPSLAAIGESCRLSPLEETLLLGSARPIVLLRRTAGPVAPAAAPGNPLLGAMLPYAPLHHLLLRELGIPLVATSGNVSDDPIAIDETEALTRLSAIADLFLVHDRPIVRPVEDSVMRIVCGRALMLRRGRGYAPAAMAVAGVPPGILALGGHLKTTVALSGAGRIVLSPHIGDLETAAARAAHAAAASDLCRLQGANPRLVVRDMHPDYASGDAAAAVQHHLAHVAACMAENAIDPPVLGVAWDGTGHGADGTVWGGEFLLIEKRGWRRVAHLRPFRLPGGDKASREPRRSAVGLLYAAFGDRAFAMTELPPVAAFTATERAVLSAMLARAVNAPAASSVGRLFDAFAALGGLRQHATYEGQAAAELEWAAGERADNAGYTFAIRHQSRDSAMVVDWQPALEAALADLRGGAAAGTLSERLHAGLAKAIVAVACRIGLNRVALTGGCFQNARLTEAAVIALREAGFEPVWHRQVPPNDGGIALGQAAWAGWTGQAGDASCA
jgi:hydrogenase maturation protein HypF